MFFVAKISLKGMILGLYRKCSVFYLNYGNFSVIFLLLFFVIRLGMIKFVLETI